MKIYEKLLLQKIKPVLEETGREEQCGFREGRSTVDAIFVIRQVLEKRWEYGKDTVIAFIDLQKAYDKVQREAIWEKVRRRGIREGIVERIKNLYKTCKSKVRIEEKYTQSFKTERGVRQGSILSPFLFNVIMDEIIAEVRGGRGAEDLKVVAYADDIMIWEDKEEELERELKKWVEVTKKYGLEMNIQKCKVMKVGRMEGGNGNVSIKGNILEKVDDFCYLGSKITNKSTIREEVGNRIWKSGQFFNLVKKILWNWNIGKETKILMYKMYYQPILLYGAETWTWNKSDLSRLQAAEMRFLRGIEKISRRDRIRNEVTRERLGVISLQETMERKRIQWMGHVKRMEDNRMPRIALEREERGRRPRGRPRGRWEDQVWKDVERRGIQRIQVEEEEAWRDRQKWRRLCRTTRENGNVT